MISNISERVSGWVDGWAVQKKESKCEIENSHDLNTICFLFPRRMYGIMFCSSSIVVELTEFGRKKRDNLHLEETTEWKAHGPSDEHIVDSSHTRTQSSIFVYILYRISSIKWYKKRFNHVVLLCFVSFIPLRFDAFTYRRCRRCCCRSCMFYYTKF